MVNIEGFTRFHTEMNTLRFLHADSHASAKNCVLTQIFFSLKISGKGVANLSKVHVCFHSLFIGAEMLNIFGSTRMLNILPSIRENTHLDFRGLG